MHPARRLATPLMATLLLAGSGSRDARADEGEKAVSVGLAYTSFSVPDHTGHGGGLSLDYEHGVTDVLWLRASALGASYLDGGELAYSGQASVGITYVLDVLRYVPYATLGVGAVGLVVDDEGAEEPIDPIRPLIELGGGLDILQSRSSSYGVYLRFESFLNRTALFQVGARMSWRWGFF